MKALALPTLAILRRHRRGLMVFYLLFAGFAFAALAPAFSWGLAALQPVTGQAAISTGGLVQFLISPGGLLWLAATATIAVLLILLQQAGMTWIAAAGGQREYRTALSALWQSARRFRQLLTLTIIQVAAHLALALPFLLVVALAYQQLLANYDGYFLLLERPPALWWFLGIAGTATLGLVLCNGWLYLRWILAVPLLVLDDQRPWAALGRSRHLMRGQRRQAILALIGGLVLVLALLVLETLLFRIAGAWLLGVVPERMAWLMAAVTGYAALYILFTVTLAFLGIAAYSTLVYAVYRQATGKPHHPRSRPLPRTAGNLVWGAEALVIVLALLQGWVSLQSFEQRDDVTITAHRGSAFKAPENTLSAIELAIEDGADYVEVDVRMTADGVPVLWHDNDMRRVFGLDGQISDITYEEARQRDAGSWFGPGFADERIVTLEQAITATRGRAGLYLDIKPDPATPTLTRGVVGLLREQDALDGTVIAAADWQVLEQVKRLEPALSTALLAQFIVGPLWQESFDILGLRQNRVTAAAVARSRRGGNELHVWTVNHPDAMARFIDMGVDNIITDRPAALAELLHSREQLTDAELLVMKVRNWMR